MAKLSMVKGTTSKIVHLFIPDSSSTTGAGLTGLVFNSASLVAYYIRPGDSSATAITLATATVGTWATGGFKEVSSTNMPGVYEFSIPDACLASGANQCVIMLKGATNMAPTILEIQLDAVNNQDAVRYGLTALPNAAAEASGGIITRGTGTGQLSVSSGQVILQAGTGTGQLDFTSGVLKSNPVQINGTSIAGTGTRVADGFVALLNVASPVLTLASVNQTGDSYARIGANGASLTAIQLPSNGLANVTAWTVAITGNITGNLSGSVGSVTGLTASDVGAIKTKTDQLTFTIANQVDSNALSGGGGLDAAGVRAAIGMASANLDTQIATLATASNLSTVSTNVSAIQAKTDNLPAAPAATGDIPTAVQNADALLKRDWTAVSGEADYSMLNAGRALRCKWDDGLTTADTYTVFKEDGIATAWYRTVTHNPAAEPVTGAS